MSLLRVLRRPPRLVCSYCPSRTYAAKSSVETAPSPEKSDAASTSAEPGEPSGSESRSMCSANTVLAGVQWLKGQPPVLALADEEYPPWLWTLLEKKELPDDGPGGKAEKVRLRRENRQRIRDQNFMKTHNACCEEPNSFELAGRGETEFPTGSIRVYYVLKTAQPEFDELSLPPSPFQPMTASFAAYASQFLNRQRNGPASLASSQPLFFSFTEDDEGSRAGNHDADLDDLDDPHLRASDAAASGTLAPHRRDERDDDDDPYLRLDENERAPPGAGASRYDSHSTPLLASQAVSEGEPSRGWLAHQPSPLRSPSPSPSSSSAESGTPPSELISPGLAKTQRPPEPSVPPPPRVIPSLSLTESLLPRDGRARPLDVFSLPDPRHISRRRRKYNDAIWTAVWCTGLSICLLCSIVILFLTRKPVKPPKVSLPYTTLLHTVPLLAILTFVSAAVSYVHILLLRVFVKPVVIATSIFVPATLLISALWAFVGSFMWDADTEPTWGETWGLRLFSLVPLVLSVLTARRLVHLPRDIHTTSSLLTLTTHLLANNPFLLALSPAVLLASLLASIPFVTLSFRLLLIGYFIHPSGGWEWHVKGWANWAIVATITIWLWSWGVARGILRVTTAGVIGAWYFADPDTPPPPPASTHTIHAALTRATSPSLGTIVLGALILTGVRIITLITLSLRRFPAYLPLAARAYAGPVIYGAGVAAAYLDNAASALGKHALIYVGITGDPFWPSARRSRALTSVVESGGAKYKKRFKTEREFSKLHKQKHILMNSGLDLEAPLTLLTIAPLTLTFPFALATYLFVAHTLGAPEQALGASFLAGGVTALVGLFCVGLIRDTADTLYLCYCIDKDVGERRRGEVFEMFEYDHRRPQTSSRHQTQTQTQARVYSSAPRPQPPPPRPQPQQPISQRVEGMMSPDSSPETSPEMRVDVRLRPEEISRVTRDEERGRREVQVREQAEDLDPFLRAYSPEMDKEEEEQMASGMMGSGSGSGVGNREIDTESVSSRTGVGMGVSASLSASRREGRDEEEGLGMSGLFPGSDLF
ncbi:hypothetical protein EW146_g4975 [Bondarzewia mesenterica]|uniref:Uncharacterized protein n=1 Tax=Bondarzewia mesenterica TaxID=1095465 RepID=A0A4S4LTX8_9AGAM|nr:hypothetical protein EW146_g4975 [Bondarzewia mesenterica]